MDPQTFEKIVKSKKINYPAYVFAGPENFLKEKAFKLMAEELVAKSEQSENVNRIVLSGKDYPDTINRIFSFSFGSSPRLFFLQGIEELNAKHRKDFLERIQRSGIPADTFLIFSVSDNKVAGEVIAKFKQQSEKIDYWTPFANQMPTWVKKEINELGADITSDAADILIDLAGSDLSTIYQELEKLALSFKGKKVDALTVKSCVGYLKKDTIFDFLEAFGRRTGVKALRALGGLLERGEPPQKIWFMLCRQLREYRLYHELCSDRPDLMTKVSGILKNYRQLADKSDFKANQNKKAYINQLQEQATEMPDALAKAIGLTNFGKIKSLHLALNFDKLELRYLWQRLLETDLKLKSGAPDPGTTIQTLVAEILSNTNKPN